jgi:PAS domain S-box-containing protein
MDGSKTDYTYEDLEKRVQVLEKTLEETRAKESISAPTRWELESLLDNSPDMIFRVDRSLRHLYVNRALAKITGLSKEDYLGKTNRDLGMPEHLCNLWDRVFSRAFEDGGPQQAEFTYTGTQGPRHYQMRIEPEKGPDGAVHTAVGITRDITGRREAEEGILHLAKFPEENPSPVMRFTKDGTILYANQASRPLLSTWGCQMGEKVPEKWQRFISQLEGAQKNVEVESEDRVFLLVFAPIKDATYVNLYGMDITEKKKTEEQLRQTERELRKHKEELEGLVKERTREINCLHRLSNLIEEYDDSLREVLMRAPELLASSLRYPDIACTRIILGDQEVATDDFQETPWGLSAGVMAEGRLAGTIKVCYLEERPQLDEGPFHKEERALLNNVAHRLGKIIERNQARERLMLQWKQFAAIFDNLADGLYVADPYSHEILLVNKALERTLGRDPVGGKCYEELQGLDIPCNFCTNEIILRDRKPYTWQYRNPVSGNFYLITDQIIEWPDGRDVRFEVAVDITERKNTEDALRRSERRLRRLSGKLAEAQEAERRHLARELHDSIGGKLSGIKYGVEKLLQDLGNNHTPEGISLEDVVAMVRETIEDSRRISSRLRPPELDDLGLLTTIKSMCRRFERLYSEMGLEPELHLEEDEVPEPLKIVIYRILQEALTNAAKYSKAQMVRVSLEKKDGGAELMVQDNGDGFCPADVCGNGSDDGMSQNGLSNMKERAELSGGQFRITSEKGEGTTIRVFWPRATKVKAVTQGSDR